MTFSTIFWIVSIRTISSSLTKSYNSVNIERIVRNDDTRIQGRRVTTRTNFLVWYCSAFFEVDDEEDAQKAIENEWQGKEEKE